MTSTLLPAGYALDPAWHAERERLESLSSLYDERSLALCERLGLTTGWHCLDVGAGTGSLARRLTQRVGPTGTVVALDVDTRFLEPLATENLQVVASDVTTEPLPSGRFDLVHARLVLEHLPARDDVLRSMAAALRPGGVLLIEDFDWSTTGLIDPPSELHARVVHACRTLFAGHAYDPEYGRKLPRRVEAAGLVEVGADAESVMVRGNADRGVPQWDLLIHQLAPGLLGHGLLDADDLEAFHALTHDPGTVCFAPLMVSAFGHAPSQVVRSGA